MKYHYIDDNNALGQLQNNLQPKTLIAIDTEFERSKTFFPVPGLLQLRCNDEIYLLDPIKLDGLNIFLSSLVENESIVVMHACKEDLEIFRVLGADSLSSNIFDTQIAASLLGHPAQISYQAVVKNLLGFEVDKGETRSNWIQRPLTDNQKNYAASDVLYLENLKNIFEAELEEKNRYQWFVEEVRNQLKTIDIDHHKYFERIKGTGRLDQESLNMVYDLCEWREKLVQDKDIPRGFVIKDKAIIEIAQTKAFSKAKLFELKEVPKAFVGRYGEDIINLFEQRSAQDKVDAMQPNIMLPKSSGLIKKAIKEIVDLKSQELSIQSEVLFSNRVISKLMQIFYEGGDVMEGLDNLSHWRYDLFSDSVGPIFSRASR